MSSGRLLLVAIAVSVCAVCAAQNADRIEKLIASSLMTLHERVAEEEQALNISAKDKIKFSVFYRNKGILKLQQIRISNLLDHYKLDRRSFNLTDNGEELLISTKQSALDIPITYDSQVDLFGYVTRPPIKGQILRVTLSFQYVYSKANKTLALRSVSSEDDSWLLMSSLAMPIKPPGFNANHDAIMGSIRTNVLKALRKPLIKFYSQTMADDIRNWNSELSQLIGAI